MSLFAARNYTLLLVIAFLFVLVNRGSSAAVTKPFAVGVAQELAG